MAQASFRADDSEGVRAETRLREFAWEPVTPRGVAAFSKATFGRLFFVELVVALLTAGGVVWCPATPWVSTAGEAIHPLPAQRANRNGRLTSPPTPTDTIATGV